jgi:hypothetical protein
LAKLFAIIASRYKRFAEGLPRDLLRRGSALGLVLVFMTFMLILGTGLLTVGQYMAIQSRAVGEADRYYYAAESAAQLAAQLLMREYNASADGAASGVLAATAASIAVLDEGAAIEELAVALIDSVGDMYGGIKATVEEYPGTGAPGFNGVPVELGTLLVSTANLEPIEISADNAAELLARGIIVFEREEYTVEETVYVALAVYFSNPNFVLTARAGGREVIVNTSVSLDFSVNIGYATTPGIEGSAPARLATLADVTITGWVGEEIPAEILEVRISGDRLIGDEEDIIDILEGHLENNEIVLGLPDNVRVDVYGVNIDEGLLEFQVHDKAVQPKSGPVRIMLPGGIFESGEPLAVTRNEDARWDIRYRDGEGVSRLPDANTVVDPDSSPVYKAFMDRRIAEAKLFATKGNFIPAGISLTATDALRTTDVNVNAIVSASNRFSVTASGTYDLEYLYCSGNVRINDGIQAAFPKLKGIYVEGNLTLQKSSRLIAPSFAAIYVGGLLSVSDNVELNNCSVYANEIEIYYSAATLQGGPFNSKSAFYPRSRLRLFGVPSANANTMPQFYIPESCVIDFDCERFPLSNLPGIFFLQGESRTDGIANEGILNRATGLFVGNFGNINRIDALSQTVLDSLWDTDLKYFLNGGPVEVPAATAEIDGEPQISGTVGEPLEEDYTFTVYVEDDEIDEAEFDRYLNEHDASELFWNAPSGIGIECVYEDSHTLRFTVFGTPESPLDAPVDIRLPGDIMANGLPVDTELNEYAFWEISGIPGSEGTSTLDKIELTPNPGNGATGTELHDITGSS